jgi:hypothetical protein
VFNNVDKEMGTAAVNHYYGVLPKSMNTRTGEALKPVIH